MKPIEVIRQACELILDENHIKKAQTLISRQYGHKPRERGTRNMGYTDKLKIFLRDGFIDRYTGKRLLFPSVLRILSIKLGQYVFPFHPNWKMSESHIAYWEYMPTCDHVMPRARGGGKGEKNMVTTSQQMNSAKSNSLIGEIGFELFDKGSLDDWDGMLSWYLQYRANHEDVIRNTSYLKRWNGALNSCLRQKIIAVDVDGKIKLGSVAVPEYRKEN